MFGSRRLLLDVRDLLMNIAFHAAAQWRIELSQIADFHWSLDVGAWSFDADVSFKIPIRLNNAPRPWPQRNQIPPP